MKYKLEPGLGRILSSVCLIFPDGTRKSYPSGSQVVESVFDAAYKVASITARDNMIEIRLEERKMSDVTVPEDMQSFF